MNDPAHRYLALGDSYTIGEGVSDAERWPVQLAVLLREHGCDLAPPQIIARTGWTTDELRYAIGCCRPHGSFDLVTLLIGVNDQFRGRSAGDYRQSFATVLDIAIACAGARPAHVVVLSVPDWGVTPFAAGRERVAIAEQIDAFNSVNRQIARDARTHYVDVTASSRGAATDPSLLTFDRLHPSGAMYSVWARLALMPALAALRDEPAT